MNDLFAYRLRMICNKWIIITSSFIINCGDYFTAQTRLVELEKMGYVDADRG